MKRTGPERPVTGPRGHPTTTPGLPSHHHARPHAVAATGQFAAANSQTPLPTAMRWGDHSNCATSCRLPRRSLRVVMVFDLHDPVAGPALPRCGHHAPISGRWNDLHAAVPSIQRMSLAVKASSTISSICPSPYLADRFEIKAISGRNKAITMKPTMPPSTMINNGSIKLMRLSVSTATSSSKVSATL